MTVASAPRAALEPAARLLCEHRGARPGPTLIIVAGVHGNEPAGIEAAQRVDALLSEAGLHAGRLIALRGNLAALSVDAERPWLRPRYIDEDLNRVFTPSAIAAHDDSAERAERDALLRTLRRFASSDAQTTYLLDLHTVSSDSPPFIALEDALATRRFALRFPLPKILGMEEELPGLMMDHAANELGCIACIVESGRHDDPGSVDVHEAVILAALASLGLTRDEMRTAAGASPMHLLRTAARDRAGHVYDVRHRRCIEDPSFRMRPGVEAFARVRERRTVLATEAGRELTPPIGGLLFMPNRQPEPRVGDDAYFIVHRINTAWLAISAWLRRQPWLHASLPRVLPGVRRRPGHAGDLLIAPEIAAVLKREFFHLLGYRIIRRPRQAYLPRRHRWRRATNSTARSTLRIALGVFHGGEKSALPGERRGDWIARRRTLDVKPPGHH